MLNFYDISLALNDMSRLPFNKSSEQIMENSFSSNYETDEKPTVLVFGNDVEIRFLLRTILDIWNYGYEEAETVEQAIRLASQKNFDLVLMDTKLKFPDSFAEMRVMRKNEFLKNAPFILLSGHVQPDVQMSAIAAGAADFFVKPINLDQLEQTLSTHISKHNRVNRKL